MAVLLSITHHIQRSSRHDALIAEKNIVVTRNFGTTLKANKKGFFGQEPKRLGKITANDPNKVLGPVPPAATHRRLQQPVFASNPRRLPRPPLIYTFYVRRSSAFCLGSALDLPHRPPLIAPKIQKKKTNIDIWIIDDWGFDGMHSDHDHCDHRCVRTPAAPAPDRGCPLEPPRPGGSA